MARSPRNQFVQPQTPTGVIMSLFPNTTFIPIPNTDGWTIGVVIITPQMATHILANHNYPQNRRLKPKIAAKYAKIMRAGRWVLSPEPLAFSSNGHLIQGQHRNKGLILSDTDQMFMVVLNVDEDDVYPILDRGAGRSLTDATGIPKDLAAVATVFCKLLGDGEPDFMREHAAQVIAPAYELLMKHCNTHTTVYSSAAVKAAACYRIMMGDNIDYVLKLYRAAVLTDHPNISSVLGSYLKHFNDQKHPTGSSTAQIDLLVWSYYVFDITKADNKSMVVTTGMHQAAVDTVKEFARTLLIEHIEA